ncbi:hypothetical protein [Peribacillus deserti]|uniref:Uncharacterized protein n=1 Tax=Peribacillus deserti TaxID=673318 RepID=A0A2N5M402_9BACI|nr:hypothetical protein [Peribacillus deserti]PLT29090.1 hypothetical protein CUU66_14830 [Peribacillus deserti]
MKQIDSDKLYKFAAICFAIAGISFLTVGILGGFQTFNIVLTVLFAINSILFFSLDKMKTNKDLN